MKLSRFVHAGAFDPLPVAEQVKACVMNEIYAPARKQLSQQLPVVGFAPNLDVYVELLRAHDQLYGCITASGSCQGGLLKTIENKRGDRGPAPEWVFFWPVWKNVRRLPQQFF